jgi:hypothetical protein
VFQLYIKYLQFTPSPVPVHPQSSPLVLVTTFWAGGSGADLLWNFLRPTDLDLESRSRNFLFPN